MFLIEYEKGLIRKVQKDWILVNFNIIDKNISASAVVFIIEVQKTVIEVYSILVLEGLNKVWKEILEDQNKESRGGS